MNKFLFIFLILFFAAAIAIGLSAIFEDVRPNSRASGSCPPQKFPTNQTCEEDKNIKLVKTSSGCYEFMCAQ